MNHEEAQQLLAAYALDAVDGEERRDLERHLEECARCTVELDDYRGVTSALGNVSQPAPAELWDRIAARLYDDGAVDPAPRLRVLDAARAPDRPARAVRPRALAGLLAVAAAIVVVLSINLLHAHRQVTQLTNALGSASRSAATVAEATTGHVDVTLATAHGDAVARFVVLHGHGYLLSSRMKPLPSGQTYQLWGIFAGQPISLGLLGARPDNVEFTVSSSVAPSALAVTVEPARGVVSPTSPIVASGTLAA